MKKLFLLLMGFIILSCLSCTKDKDLVSLVNGNKSDRLVFKNFEEFNDTYLLLQTKFHTMDELSLWAYSKKHSTLLYSLDSTIVDYSEVLKTILNRDSEFELSDSIVLFNNGTLYAYSKNESNKITLKDNPEKYRNIGIVSLNTPGIAKAKSTSIAFSGGLNANNQSIPFYQQTYVTCGTGGELVTCYGQRKFVDELYSETVGNYTYIYLRIKLEYKGSSWHAAGEPYTIMINDIPTTITTDSGYTHSFTLTSKEYELEDDELYTCVTGNLYFGLGCLPKTNDATIWTVSMPQNSTYHIFHQVHGDTSGFTWTDNALW
ncbi:MAG: hypothetical protein LLG13_08855 [Bacteroidales bacterium]|nr:hypothetical protein [Bacteroidales bacterium]